MSQQDSNRTCSTQYFYSLPCTSAFISNCGCLVQTLRKMFEEPSSKNKAVKLLVLMKTSNNFIPKMNILFSYTEKLLPSVITCHSHFHGVITGVKKNTSALNFSVYFPINVKTKFCIETLGQLIFRTRRSTCIRALKKNAFAGYVLFPETLFNNLVFYPKEKQIPIPSLHCLIPYFTLYQF